MSVQGLTNLYLPLKADHIRVLVLCPGSFDDPIECHLEHQNRDLDGGVSYEALSYMWGPPEPPREIKLNDTLIEVRQNLLAALRRLRNENSVRYLWVDALCINQQDLQERSAQVLVMSRIYRRASQVLVWLGEAQGESDMLIDLLTDSKGDFGPIWPSRGQPCRPRMELPAEKMVIVRDAFLALCNRPYWRRVWIIQEILSTLSLELLCGAKKLAWTHFCSALSSIKIACSYSSVYSSTPAWYIASEWGYLRTVGTTISLARLVHLCSSCQSECQDVR
jgi:Heterokaryon incompatibility protein (HET)